MTGKMKKILSFIFLYILFILLTTCASASILPEDRTDQAESAILPQAKTDSITAANEQAEPTFKLPASLTTIEDSAFEGTAITFVSLPESVEEIGDNAFANIPTLKGIRIPDSTTSISATAFEGSNQVTIAAASGSYAGAWAKKNSIPFSPVVNYYVSNHIVQVTGISSERVQLQKIILADETTETTNQTKPTGRMAGELSADKYEMITAFHIQGRSPPVC